MNNYLIESIIRQTFEILILYMIFKDDKWGRLGLAAAVVSVWIFIRDITVSTVSIIICLIDLSFAGFDHYGSLAVKTVPLISYPIAALIVYIIFCKTRLSEKRFLYGGKLLFFVSIALLILSDICGFGITHGVMLAAFNGSKYWTATRNEILTHLEVIIVSALCLTISLSVMYGMSRLIEYIMTEGIYKQKISHYKTMLSQYEKQINVRHDMKNHLISMSALVEKEEWDKLKEYLSKIIDSDVSGENEIETENSVINAIISINKKAAEADGIKFDCEVNIYKPLDIDDYDLCVIWGNILDNAVTAAGMAYPEKYVHVQAEIVKKNLIINVKNTTGAEFINEKFGEKDFGTGLMNVKKIVEKKNGILNIDIANDIFDISIMLPVVC